MHDITSLEARGIPAGFVASAEFIEAAASQAKSLGIIPAAVYVPHPIQDRTDEEMVQMAGNAIEDIIALIQT
ncbi:MAG: hypothetical protein JKY98_10030 [Gammaproteobacteria bacterium]|nr:hypothetical protein [Gammaproteobacteria bacterium]